MELLRNFLRDEEGQDLVEYTLLLAFVALAAAALFIGAGASINNIWKTTSGTLANADTASGGS